VPLFYEACRTNMVHTRSGGGGGSHIHNQLQQGEGGAAALSKLACFWYRNRVLFVSL